MEAIDLLRSVPHQSLCTAVREVIGRLRSANDPSRDWLVLHHLLTALRGQGTDLRDEEEALEIVGLCQQHLVTLSDDLVTVRNIGAVLKLSAASATECAEWAAIISLLAFSVTASPDSTSVKYQRLELPVAVAVLEEVIPALALCFPLLVEQHEGPLHEALLRMISSKDEKLVASALSQLLPALVGTSARGPDLLLSVFNELRTLSTIDGDNRLVLTALCSMSDLVFCGEGCGELWSQPWFLTCVQQGLSSAVAADRKRCQYLVKRYADVVGVGGVVGVWDALLLLVETLEEKQMHIIKPVLVYVDVLVELVLVQGQADRDWLGAVLRRLLLHENASLVRWTLGKICRMDLASWPGFWATDLAVQLLLRQVNSVVFFSAADDGQSKGMDGLGGGQDVAGGMSSNAGFRSRNDGIESRTTEVMSRNDGIESRTTGGMSRNDGIELRTTGTMSRNTGIESSKAGMESRTTRMMSRNDGIESSTTGAEMPSLSLDLSHFFNRLISMLDTSERVQLTSRLLEELARVPWNSVALLHVCWALASIRPTPGALDDRGCRALYQFLSSWLHTQHVLLRGAVQGFVLEAFTNMAAAGQLSSLHWAALLVSAMDGRESFDRRSASYARFALWVGGHFERRHVVDVLDKLTACYLEPTSANCEKNFGYGADVVAVARFALLALDCHVAPRGDHVAPRGDHVERVAARLRNVFALADGCRTRLYADRLLIARVAALMAVFAREFGHVADFATRLVVRVMEPVVGHVVEHAVGQVRDSGDVGCVDEMARHVEAFSHLPCGAFSQVPIGHVAAELLIDSRIVTRYKGVCLLGAAAAAAAGVGVDEHVARLVQSAEWRRHVALGDEEARLLNVTRGVFMSRFFAATWRLLHECLVRLRHVFDAAPLLDYGLDCLDMAGADALPWIMRCFSLLFRTAADSELSPAAVRTAIEACWSACADFRRTDRFRQLMNEFVRMAFGPELLRRAGRELRSYLFGLLDRLSSDTYAPRYLEAAAGAVVDSWFTGWPGHQEDGGGGGGGGQEEEEEAAEDDDDDDDDSPVLRLVVDLLLYGSIRRKDEVVQLDTCLLVRSFGDRCPVNGLAIESDVTDAQLRLHGLGFVTRLQVGRRRRRHLQAARRLCDALLERDASMASLKNRHFANSMTHRTKNRIWTALFLLAQLFIKGASRCGRLSTIGERCLSGLIDDNPQPSVRFLHEWIVTRILVLVPSWRDHFWTTMDRAVDQRAGSMVSFLTIIGHTVRCLGDTDTCDPLSGSTPGTPELELFLHEALPRIIPWAMAQHFTPRLYGNVILAMVWDVCQSRGVASVVSRYEPIVAVVRRAPEMPNARKNLEKLGQDFYLSVFHAVRHLSLETLLHHLPRLSHLARDEWITAEQLAALGPSLIPVANQDRALHRCQPAEWVARAAGGGAPAAFPDEQLESSGVLVNVQKKVTPWKYMVAEVGVGGGAQDARKRSAGYDLIVVATLVDRLPNLGGLCRTCEVLGVKQLVLSNVKVVDDKDFTSLSVSSEKWIRLHEVKRFELIDYLKRLKQQGYSVVGAEQTADSVPLNRFQFPTKAVLVLGNEKEGIPVEMLQQLDVCVEVPQDGVIRSMNVHVTASVFIWEYVRQHITTKSSP